MSTKLAVIITAFSLLMLNYPSLAASITLYDGASGVTPNQYPDVSSTFFTFNSPNGGTQQASGGVTNLNTTANNSIYAGYSNYNNASLVNSSFPSLDRNAGYTLSFTVKINSEADTADATHPRAGFSVIALSSDKQGIEIGFGFNNNTVIFSQDNSSFNQIGENYSSASTLLESLTQYDLTVSGSTYTLSSGSTTILSGALRNYTAATGFGSDVYRTSNFIFLGDDTTSANANIDLKYVALTTNSAGVPYEFSPSLGILALAACGGVTHLMKKKNS
ncbi:PEP-CTERM sorting domain-containing protein [Aetokthonos hydrillicola Thurmond2011]|uniref:PEP-CTERM sorting domain-containing protein n=1 Tax=Aetokthonos hydrillicola Thurmond2011 TaxID=2712845 RepID=A0AAP5MB60_9CYAN|nr:PEP-CTERM sorting domain-containing protein [Aetokthonos hydrillicola]MBO3458907.1 PEP-CTERM sorting domain-containing protein [Aetokthonos hydrillicola CCALA 1050]MBW4587244.1 PEP-CTERM sorting domain-containing protein [Aetokthonos hydrillicola CCALA 1050]MDR9896733.1 PEP-CTERM sorting domain-containing protein [Aetokthonos hydrillicola Thurmond2011]